LDNLNEDERRKIAGRRNGDKFSIWDRRVRDIGIYIVAILGVINQLFFVEDPSETTLVFLAAMLGFPLVLKADEFRRTDNINGSNGK
jgi:hypothetical protein